MNMINSSSKKISLNSGTFGTSFSYGKVIEKRDNAKATFNDFNNVKTEDYDFEVKKGEQVYGEDDDIKRSYEQAIDKLDNELNELQDKYNQFMAEYQKNRILKSGYRAKEISAVTIDAQRDFYAAFAREMGMSYQDYQNRVDEIRENKRILKASYAANIFRNSSAADIFTESTYGGNQSTVANLVSSYILGDSLNTIKTKQAIGLVDLIKKYYPNATDMEIINLAKLFESWGCGYIAMANALCTYIGNFENGNEFFKQRFGFDLYYVEDGTKYYNVEEVALNFFLDRFKNLDIHTMLSDDIGAGVGNKYLRNEFTEFLEDHGINVVISNFDIDVANYAEMYDMDSIKDVILEYMSYYPDNTYITLSASHFDLVATDGLGVPSGSRDSALSNSLPSGNVIQDVGGHLMLVTGIDQSGNPIVSSWSGEYQFVTTSPEEYLAKYQDDVWLSLKFVQFNIIEGE